MTKQEALEYCEELESAIDQAFGALQDGDSGQAMASLSEYTQKDGETDGDK